MNKKDLLSERTSISDIKQIKCDDGVTRSHIDTPDKLIYVIRSEFKRLSYKPKEFHKLISISNCIINIGYESGLPSLCDVLDKLGPNEKLDLFEKNDTEGKLSYVIKKRVTYLNCTIHTGSFKNVTFLEDVSFHDSYFLKDAIFINCQFNKKITFANVKFEKGLDFEKNIFNGDVVFSHSKVKGFNIDFNGCTFKEEFKAQGLKLSISDQNAKSDIDFSKSVFHKDVDLSYIDFDRACNFANTKILGDIIFRKSNFLVSVNFYAMKLEGDMLFSSYPEEESKEEITSNIINQISFKRAKINGRIDFEKYEIESLEASFVDIQKDALFRIYESEIKSLDFESAYNGGVIILKDNLNNIDEITFESAINTGIIEIENSKLQNIKDRKTARILKDSAIKNGNTIDALDYRKAELDLLKKESDSIKRGTKLLLRLNGLSNDHGTDWVKGLKFTIYSWLGFYVLFLLFSRLQYILDLTMGKTVTWAISSDISNGIRYLWSLDFLNTLSTWVNQFSFQGSWWIILLELFQILFVTLIFILGKIAIAYGIYQTITAFRKYKN